MNIDTAHALFVRDLQDIYDAELQLEKAIPKMKKASITTNLSNAFEKHYEETLDQIKKLETIAQILDINIKGQKRAGIHALISEGKEIIKKESPNETRDLAIIDSARKVENYEKVAYESLVSMAELLGHSEAMRLLQETLEEEKACDTVLTEIRKDLMDLEIS